jgi:hypothetical protein
MNSFTVLFQRENLGQLILCILFVIYLLMGASTPPTVSKMIDTIYGKIFVIVIAVLLFMNSNPILGILGIVVAYELIRHATGNYALEQYLPTEKKKSTNLTAMNQFPYTLEQEVVKKMAPVRQTAETRQPVSFHPILDDLHDAAPINYEGVI